MKIKKAAMFGLDARIALAIFGALSVISSATLYSAIQNSKAESYRQTFENCIKALEAYFLDHGSFVPKLDSVQYASLNFFKIGYLAKNIEGSNLWKGPYINIPYNLDTSLAAKSLFNLKDDNSLALSLRGLHSGDWTNKKFSCTNYNECQLWLIVNDGALNQETKDRGYDLYKLLDSKIDNNDGPLHGSIRYREPMPLHYNVYYKTPFMYNHVK